MQLDKTIEHDWWTLRQLAERWRTSFATVRRRSKLPADNPLYIKTMPIGTRQVRVHINEIKRHEAAGGGQTILSDTLTHRRPVRIASLLEKKMDRLRQKRELFSASARA